MAEKLKDRVLPAHYRLTGGDVAGIAGPLANMVLPGLGSVFQVAGGVYDAAKAKQQSFQEFDKLKTNTNSFGYAHGGKLDGGTIKGSADLGLYLGPSHASGGVKVNSTTGTPDVNGEVEVEGDETVFRKNYIFSKRLKV